MTNDKSLGRRSSDCNPNSYVVRQIFCPEKAALKEKWPPETNACHSDLEYDPVYQVATQRYGNIHIDIEIGEDSHGTVHTPWKCHPDFRIGSLAEIREDLR